MLGISTEMQETALRLVKKLAEIGKKMSGVIIKIEGVGHGFCWGVNPEDLEKSGEYFQDNSLNLKFTVLEIIVNMPAGEIMNKVHLLNDTNNLPGIIKFLEQQKKAA